MTCFSVANVIGSTLTKTTSAWLPLTCGYEISVPATKTFTNQVITFLYLATCLAGGEAASLDALPELMEKTIRWTDPQTRALADSINAWNDLYSPVTAAPTPRLGRRAQTERNHLRPL